MLCALWCALPTAKPPWDGWGQNVWGPDACLPLPSCPPQSDDVSLAGLTCVAICAQTCARGWGPQGPGLPALEQVAPLRGAVRMGRWSGLCQAGVWQGQGQPSCSQPGPGALTGRKPGPNSCPGLWSCHRRLFWKPLGTGCLGKAEARDRGLVSPQRTPESSSRPRQRWDRGRQRSRDVGSVQGGCGQLLWCLQTCAPGKTRLARANWQVPGCPPGPLWPPPVPSPHIPPVPGELPFPISAPPGRPWTLLPFPALVLGVPWGTGGPAWSMVGCAPPLPWGALTPWRCGPHPQLPVSKNKAAAVRPWGSGEGAPRAAGVARPLH